MSKLRLLTLVSVLAAACAPLYGCGSECASGTVDEDGQCVVDKAGCAVGTRLENGTCVLDTTGCGPNTMLEGDACVPVPEMCKQGTTFDQGSHSCKPDAEVVCGERTEVGPDGRCVPGQDACGSKTRLEAGNCIVGAASCGKHTELDPKSGKCMLVEAGCGSGLAYESDSDTCVPTDEICEAGTEFDVESGLCLNASCRSGDVLVDGKCMSVGEDIARDPDVTETENNDPDYGDGAAETLTLGPAGGMPTTFVGGIGEPTDLDGDGAVDQDRDVYEFEATAAEWFDIQVYSTGLQAPGFLVEGPNDFARYSPIVRDSKASRMVMAPEDGTYTVTVLPSLTIQRGAAANPIGGPDWSYSGKVAVVQAPEPTQVDLASGDVSIAGDYHDLGDNLFHFTGLKSGDIVSLDAVGRPDGVDPIVQVSTMANGVNPPEPIGLAPTELVVDDPSAVVLLDYVKLVGSSSQFEFDVSIAGSQKITTLQPDGSQTFTVHADLGDQLVATQENPQDKALDVTIVQDGTGDEIAADDSVPSGGTLAQFVDVAGDYTVTFTNKTGGNVDATLRAKALPPLDFGQIPPGAIASTSEFGFAEDTVKKIKFSVGPDQLIEIYHANSEDDDHAFNLANAQGDEIADESYFDPLSYFSPDYMYWYSEQGGSFELTVTAKTTVPNEQVFIHAYHPEAVNLPTVGTSLSHTGPGLLENQFHFYKVNIGVDSDLKVVGASDNGETIDLTIYDTTFSEIDDSGYADDIDETFDLSAGEYLMGVESTLYPIGSYDITFSLQSP